MPHFDYHWIIFKSQLGTDSFFNFIFLFFGFLLKPTEVIIVVVVPVTVAIVIVIVVIIVVIVVVMWGVRRPICGWTSGVICVGSIWGRVRCLMGRRISGKGMSGYVRIGGGSGTRPGCVPSCFGIIACLLCWNWKSKLKEKVLQKKCKNEIERRKWRTRQLTDDSI